MKNPFVYNLAKREIQLAQAQQWSQLILPIGLTEIPSTITRLKNLEKLVSVSGKIRNLNLLSELTQLTQLCLFDNDVDVIQPLAALTQLKILNLSQNSVSDIAPLAALKQLCQLDLAETGVGDFTVLTQLSHLHHLRIDSIQLGYLNSLKGCSTLRQLEVIAHSEAGWIPLELCYLQEVISLESLLLEGYTPEFGVHNLSFLAQMPKLRQLTLNQNLIEDLTPLTQLKHLGKCRFQPFPTFLNCLKNYHGFDSNFEKKMDEINLFILEFQLDLSYNRIHDLKPLQHFISPFTRSINLSNNQITDLSPLKDFKNLEKLELAHNQIRTIRPLQKMKNLSELDLSHNCIAQIASFKGLKSLRDLHLNHNPLRNLLGLKSQYLKVLTLSDMPQLDTTQLASFSCHHLAFANNPNKDLSFLAFVKDLLVVDLSNNQLKDLNFLLKMPKLRYLNLSDNPLQTLEGLENCMQLDDLQFSELSDELLYELLPIVLQLSELRSLHFHRASYPCLHPLKVIRAEMARRGLLLDEF